jgi:hypothetical protein
MRTSVLVVLGGIPLAAGALGCRAPGTGSVQQVDSAGVEIVLNTGADRELDWSFAERYRLGGADEGPEAFFQVNRWVVGTDKHGMIFVLDLSNIRVEVFDSSGRHVRTLGAKGGGPGEFRYPFMLAVGEEGNVAVMDWGKGALVRFASDGSIVDQVSFSDLGQPAGSFRLRADTAWLLTKNYGEGSATQVLRRLFGTSMTAVLELPFDRGRPVRFDCGIGLTASEPVFARDLVWDLSGPKLAVNTGPAYVIDIYVGDDLVSSVRREGELRPVTRELAVREVGDGMTIRVQGMGDCVVSPDEVVEKRGYTEFVPAIRNLMFAPDGGLWVERYTLRGGAPRTDVFTASGQYVGTLTGRELPLAFLPNGDIIATETDESDVQRLVVYRVRRT